MIGKGTLSTGHAGDLTLDDQASMEKLADSVVSRVFQYAMLRRGPLYQACYSPEEQTNDDSVDIPQDLATRQVEDRLPVYWAQRYVCGSTG